MEFLKLWKSRGPEILVPVIKESAAPEQIKPVDFSGASTVKELTSMMRGAAVTGYKRNQMYDTGTLVSLVQQMFNKEEDRLELSSETHILDDEASDRSLRAAIERILPLHKLTLELLAKPVVIRDADGKEVTRTTFFMIEKGKPLAGVRDFTKKVAAFRVEGKVLIFLTTDGVEYSIIEAQKESTDV